MTEAEIVQAPAADVQVFDSRAKALYEKIAEIKVVDEESLRLVTEVMAQVKTQAKIIEEAFKPHLKRAWDAHKGLSADRNRSIDCLNDAEKLAKEKIGFYYIEAEATGRIPEIDGLSVSDDWTGEVEDAAKLPKKFLTPNLDLLKEHTKLYKEATNIPGWKIVRKKRVAQRV